MVKIARLGTLDGLMRYPAHPNIILLLQWFSVRYSNTTITAAFEKRKDSSAAVHSTLPYKAIDVKADTFKNPEVIVEDINEHWVFDPEKKHIQCAFLTRYNGEDVIHLQVSDNTILNCK